MPGRGDNNKAGSAGRGAGNQSNQPFVTTEEQGKKSNHNKNSREGQPSTPQEKTKDSSVERDTRPKQQHRNPRVNDRTFDVLVDGVPYQVTSVPFYFNEQLRFRIHINGNPEHIFTWDSELGALRAIDDESSVIPDGLEEAISQELEEEVMA